MVFVFMLIISIFTRCYCLQKEPFCGETLNTNLTHPAASESLAFVLSYLAASLNLQWMLLWLIVYNISSVCEL